MDDIDFFNDLVELFDTYVAMIDKQDEIIIALKEEIKFLRGELNLPSHIITSPPTPFSVDTCEERIGSACKS